mmetsp:Transcript_28503/g.66911  ORF Transcript_28503/g.66911 Transcript_28503/m.66911 type:complete len:263 (-) Transcript_28503:572-1360(-)
MGARAPCCAMRIDRIACNRFGRYDEAPRDMSLSMFRICETDFPACTNDSGALLLPVAPGAIDGLVVVSRDCAAPDRVGEFVLVLVLVLAVTETELVRARRADVRTRRSVTEFTKNFPDDSTSKGVEVYFSMSGWTVSCNRVDSTICRYFLELIAALFSLTMGTLSAQSASQTNRFKRGGRGRKISACFSFPVFFSRSANFLRTASGVLAPSCFRTAHKIGRNSALETAYCQQFCSRCNSACSDVTFRSSFSNSFCSASPMRL